MTPAHIAVTATGVLLIAWIFLYFFRGGRTVAVARGEGVQEIEVEVQSSYNPSKIEVEAGRPLRLNFLRRDTSSCTEEVVFGDFGIRRFLPTGQTVSIEFTPTIPGLYDFTCGMGMVHGQLRVEPPRQRAPGLS